MLFLYFYEAVSKKKKRHFNIHCSMALYSCVWLLCDALRGSSWWLFHWSTCLFLLQKKEKSGLGCIRIDQINQVIFLYLSPEGLDIITQSKYSLAAMESSTLLTSLVKVPSTCLLLNSSSLLCVSDLSMHDIMCHLSQNLSSHRITYSGKWLCLCDHFVIGWNPCQK